MINLFGFGSARRPVADSKIGLVAPVRGVLFPLEEFPDPVFSQGVLGFGYAVHTDDDVVVSPVKGQIFQMFPTAHAFSVRTPEGVDVLVHIGVDTVGLKGNGFRPLKIQGNYVEQGEPVVELENMTALRSALPCLDTAVVVTHSAGLQHGPPRFDAAFGEVVLEMSP